MAGARHWRVDDPAALKFDLRSLMRNPIRALSPFLAIVVAATTCIGCARQDSPVGLATPSPDSPPIASSHAEVQGAGVVMRLLPDDDSGSAHQRFIIRLPSGQTLLIAHNIDLAPAVDNLRVGDTIEYKGEYEWNPNGGVVHWTHHDPAHQHADGWLKHDGHVFQ